MSAITEYRKANNLTQTAFGEMVGVQAAAVSKWSSGRVPAEQVVKIHKATGIPKHELRPDLFDRED